MKICIDEESDPHWFQCCCLIFKCPEERSWSPLAPDLAAMAFQSGNKLCRCTGCNGEVESFRMVQRYREGHTRTNPETNEVSASMYCVDCELVNKNGKWDNIVTWQQQQDAGTDYGSLTRSHGLTASALRTHDRSKCLPHPYVCMRNLAGTEIGLAGVVKVNRDNGQWQMSGKLSIDVFYEADRRHWIRRPTMEEVQRNPGPSAWYMVLEESQVPTVIIFQSGRVAVKGDLLGEEGPEVQALITKHQPDYEEKECADVSGIKTPPTPKMC